MGYEAAKEAALILIANQPVTPPPLLWGRIGEGKSSFCEAVAQALGYNYYQLCASHIDPASIAGIPVPDMAELITRFLPPEFVAQNRLLLFLDEINTAPESVVAAVMELVRTKRLGGRVYSDLKVVLAANPTEEAAGGYILPKPLCNRVVHLNFELPLAEFARITALPPHRRNEHAVISQQVRIATPEELEAQWEYATAVVDGFLGKFPQHFRKQKVAEDEVAFPTPRAWDNVKIVIAVFKAVNATNAALEEAVAGIIGVGVAVEFFRYLSAFDMPDVEEILSKPDVFLTLRADIVAALLSAIPARLAVNPNIVEKAFEFCLALERLRRIDYAYLLAMRLIEVCNKLQITPPLRVIAQFKHETLSEVVNLAKQIAY